MRWPSCRAASISSVENLTRLHPALRWRNRSTAASRLARPGATAGTKCAINLPCRVMAMVSPCSTIRRSSEKRDLASDALISRMVTIVLLTGLLDIGIWNQLQPPYSLAILDSGLRRNDGRVRKSSAGGRPPLCISPPSGERLSVVARPRWGRYWCRSGGGSSLRKADVYRRDFF